MNALQKNYTQTVLSAVESTLRDDLNNRIAIARRNGSKPELTPEFLEKRETFANLVKKEYEEMQKILEQIDATSDDQIQNLLDQLRYIKSPIYIVDGVNAALRQVNPAFVGSAKSEYIKAFANTCLKVGIEVNKDLHQEVEAGEADEIVNGYFGNRFSKSGSFFESKTYLVISMLCSVLAFISLVASVIYCCRKSKQIAAKEVFV